MFTIYEKMFIAQNFRKNKRFFRYINVNVNINHLAIVNQTGPAFCARVANRENVSCAPSGLMHLVLRWNMSPWIKKRGTRCGARGATGTFCKTDLRV